MVGDSEGFVDFCPNCGARMKGGEYKFAFKTDKRADYREIQEAIRKKHIPKQDSNLISEYGYLRDYEVKRRGLRLKSLSSFFILRKE